ncbi:MAG: hypothetical protein JJT96_10185 [Opitutales bacterium]|nr:hypothetical protein [Opitutales bacterium]
MRHLRFLPAALGFALAPALLADPTDPVSPLVTVTFSSALTEVLHDQRAENLDDSFTFALGVFANEFLPTSANTSSWISNFVPFFEADFADQAPAVPRFGGEAEMMSDGSSSANPATTGTFSFSGMEAWLWVYNGVDIEDTGTEWFLGRANDWVFPTFADLNPERDCDDCPGSFPVQWALSDLFQTAPVWGRREAQEGAGFVINPNESAKLQTYAVIPEPRTWVFVAGLFSIFVLHFRHRRQS